MINWQETKAAIFRSNKKALKPIREIDIPNLELLVGLKRQKELLYENTDKFIKKSEANHALLWGQRGCGKSTLAKAIFGKFYDLGLRVVEIRSADLLYLEDILDEIRESSFKFIIFCDDLSFEEGDFNYKYLKPLLEGSLELAPKNVLMYATSNRRHLLPEYQKDNLDVEISNDELHYGDAIEERLSLSDRFGLSIGFYQGSYEEYLLMVESYFRDYKGDKEELFKKAREFSMTRASRSGRTAKQFYLAYKDKF